MKGALPIGVDPGYTRMRALALVAVVLVMACGSSSRSVASKASPAVSNFPTASATGAPPTQEASAPRTEPPQPSPTPSAPSVQCLQGATPSSLTVITEPNVSFLFDVTDPTHPHVVCRIANTYVHITTGTSFEYLKPRPDGITDVVLHTLGTNNESVVATTKADLYHAYFGGFASIAWSSSSNTIAYLKDGGTAANGLGVTDVWLATAAGRAKIFNYVVGGMDAFSRPGIPPPTLGFSADGQYLAAGWTIAQSGVRVVRLADLANVTPAWPADFRFALWAKTGQTLYVVGGASVAQWTPGGKVTALPSTPGWVLGPNFSPDGTQVAFTAATPTSGIKAYVYDLNARSSRLLSSQPRSSTVFVKAGWVWYVEEKPCVQTNDNPCFEPTVPIGRVLAFELSTGRESAVTFAAGESPNPPGSYDILGAGDLWPRSWSF